MNPFDNIDKKLSNIENSLLELKLQSQNKEQPKTQDEYWTRTQLCKYLQISKPTAIRLTFDGEIRAYRLGSSIIRYLKSDIEKYSLKAIKTRLTE